MSRIFPTTLPRFLPLLVTLAACSLFGSPAVLGQSAWYEGFEQQKPSWQLLGGDGQFTIRDQQRTAVIRNTGERSEKITVVGQGGAYVYMAHDVGRPRVIDELVPTIQIRSDRAGIQLLAELAFPRSLHPQTKQPLTVLVRGTSYSNVGKWQQLRIDDLPRQLTRQTQILRQQFGSTVDSREAYVSRIVLNVFGGPGTTNVWIDDLDIAGYVASSSSSSPPVANLSPPAAREVATESSQASAPWQGDRYAATDGSARPRVRLDRSVLLVDERPFFVRAIRWRGEPFTVLKVRGFNTIWLERSPSADMLAQADQAGIWLICPAPALPPTSDPIGAAPTVLGPEYGRVLAWDLGGGLGEGQKESVRVWADQIRAADSRFRRPLIARPDSDLRGYSRIADILVIGRPALGSGLELSDYAEWLRLRPQLARPGTPIWVVVPTDPEPALLAQWQAMSPGGSGPAGFSSEQLRLITYLSCASAARGLLFESHTPMDSTGEAAEVRRVTLELLNLELGLAEPWLADASSVAIAEPRDPEILATVFRRDRDRLVMALCSGHGAGQVPAPASQRKVSVLVPGVPEADEAHEMAPGRLRWARSNRTNGGTLVTVDQFALTSQILLTQDPSTRTSRSRLAMGIGRRAAELQRRLAQLETEQLERLIVPLSLAAPATPQLKALEADVPTFRRAAAEALRKCDQAIGANNHADAYAYAEEAMRPYRLLEREHWLAASRSLTGLASSPMLATFAALPGHWALQQAVSQRTLSANLLPGGDFEDLQTWQAAGWDHVQYPAPGVVARADLAAEAAHSGGFGLALTVKASDPKQVPQLVESPPVWIASAPIHLETQSIVVIRGWARIPQPLQGGADGLLIMDSLTEPALGERIYGNDQWQEFVLYRICPASGPLRLKIALSGIGTAWLDDVTIQVLGPNGASVQARATYPATRARAGDRRL